MNNWDLCVCDTINHAVKPDQIGREIAFSFSTAKRKSRQRRKQSNGLLSNGITGRYYHSHKGRRRRRPWYKAAARMDNSEQKRSNKTNIGLGNRATPVRNMTSIKVKLFMWINSNLGMSAGQYYFPLFFPLSLLLYSLWLTGKRRW